MRGSLYTREARRGRRLDAPNQSQHPPYAYPKSLPCLKGGAERMRGGGIVATVGGKRDVEGAIPYADA